MQNQKLLLTGDYPLIASPTIAKAYGTASANFLQKLHYCLQNSKDAKLNMGKKYWFHSFEDWVKTIGLYSVPTIKRVVKKLSDEGIIIVKKLSAKSWLQTNFYTINYQKLAQIFTPQAQESKQPQQPKVKVAMPTPPKPSVTMPTVQELKGALQPVTLGAKDTELMALEPKIKQFYQILRQHKVDVHHTDPRLQQWLQHQQHIINLIVYLKKDGINKYQWHTPEQLQLDKIIKG